MLALTTMQKYPGVRIEHGLSQHQWEQKKSCILQPSDWGGDLKVHLLAIAIGRETVGSLEMGTSLHVHEDFYATLRQFQR